ncbi:MAG: rhodanese-like domain-containing protein [Myxococcota bacterium]|nr:rhodanese-like domain-containing protein [Myxococcota bacterium]
MELPVFVDVQQARALVTAGAAVVDARGFASWALGRIPGAGSLGWTELAAERGRCGVLTSDLRKLETAFQSCGVDNDSPVLVVGKADQAWGEEARQFWTLELLGHPRVHILDGGMQAWKAAGLEIRRLGRPASGHFRGRWTDRRADRKSVQAAMERGDARIWDTRSQAEFQGATPFGEARGGHIPGALHLDWKALMGPEGRLLPEPELRATLEGAGLGPGSPIIALCTGGIRAAFGYAVLRHLGYAHPRVYDGSMWEWAAEPGLPLER